MKAGMLAKLSLGLGCVVAADQTMLNVNNETRKKRTHPPVTQWHLVRQVKDFGLTELTSHHRIADQPSKAKLKGNRPSSSGCRGS